MNANLQWEQLETELMHRLAETPTDAAQLWSAYWGERDGDGSPRNAATIATDLIQSKQSRTILVHGRYGSGKSSFLRLLESLINQHSLVLWLDMASLTSRIDSTALAAVMASIADLLQKETRGLEGGDCEFGTMVEDLWRIEAGALRRDCGDECDCTAPPEANRMAGQVFGEGARTVAANRLEASFEECLSGIQAKHGMKKFLTVFLDDLDRCERRVALDVVRLLLRFSHVSHIHFVLASDWDVLEQGVKDWMASYGKADHGAPLVTANSALEKYIHTAVELPSMGQLAMQDVAAAVPGWLVALLEKQGVQQGEAFANASLAELLVANTLAELNRVPEQGEEHA